MKRIFLAILIILAFQGYSQDLNWNTSAIPDGSTSFNFGAIGNSSSTVTFNVTGPGDITSGPARFTTAQGDITFRTAVDFNPATEIKSFTFTFSPAVCNLTFSLYDIDGSGASGDKAVVTADNSGSPENITMTALDANPPTITGSGSTTATVTGTQGNQTDNRVAVNIAGCITTLTIQYSSNGSTGGRSFSIGNLEWAPITWPPDLDWNSVSYTTGDLGTNFGTIGFPAANVTLNITGSTALINGGFPVKYIAAPAGNACVVNCALRTSINFSTLSQNLIYTFTFNKGVGDLTFNLYDIDGTNTSGDQAIVTADFLGAAQNVTMTALDPSFPGGSPTIAGSGTAIASATGTQGNQGDDRVAVYIAGNVTTITIEYRNNPLGSAGGRSFSIGNFEWTTAQSPFPDLVWNTSAIPDLSTSYNFGSIGSPAVNVNYAITGPGTILAGPTRFKTAQDDSSWRTQLNFTSVSDLKTSTLTFNSAVCGLVFNLYDVDGDNTNGDRAIVTADYLGTPQTITMTALDPAFPGGPPTITGSGTNTATATGTQGNQSDDRVQVMIPGCVSTLTIQYGNNPSGVAGTRSFSIGDLNWNISTLPVSFLNFSGQKTATNAILLNWTVGNEIGIAKYEIESSKDGQQFEYVGNVTAYNTTGSYSFTDNVAAVGTLFYRIKEIDIDGRYQFSSIIVLRFTAISNADITVFPNPANHSLFITTNDNSVIQKIIVFDGNGKIVIQHTGAENHVDVSKLSAGIYWVRVIKSNGEAAASTFLKK